MRRPAASSRRRCGRGPPSWPTRPGRRGRRPAPGGGPFLSRTETAPRLLEAPTEHDGLVEEFDRLAEAYDFYVRPFSVPLFSEALDMLAPLLTPDARVLDAGCGPGRELRAVARRVPDGEVVGVDLAAGMVVGAHRAAWAAGLDNTAFVQSDVGDLPRDLDGAFDLVYNCLAHHHYPDPAAAAAGIRRCLRPGGHYAIIDPGPQWFVRLASTLSLAGDPGWIGFHTPEQFRELLEGAGFVDVAWYDLLPGFGIALGRVPGAAG